MPRMNKIRVLTLWLAVVCGVAVSNAYPQVSEDAERGEMPMAHHGHNDMTMDATGMVMNSNATELPRDCPELGPDYEFTISAGREFAAGFPGNVFGMSQREIRVEACSRITVTFINKDRVRHQWMVHGLPKYLYRAGMFHIETAGGASKTGTFIVPSDDRTYLIHCDMPQHTEMGMKAQLVVGRGSGDLWGIPGVSSSFERDDYSQLNIPALLILSVAIGLIVTASVFMIFRV